MDSLWAASTAGSGCFQDCNRDGVLDLFDWLCFIADFNAHVGYADCNDDGIFDFFDFLCYQNSFNASC
jgi:hypothetical protein